MKRIFVLFLLSCLLLVPGCSAGHKTMAPEEIDFVFSCKIDVASRDGNFTCAFNRAGKRDASVAILSGSGEGLKWYWSGNTFRQTYNGLSAENETCVLPEKSFASVLVNALDLAEQRGTLKRTDGNAFSGSMDGGTFTITADGNTGKIVAFSMPDRSLNITFRDYDEPAYAENAAT
jgi:hypothetical protein